jgi:NTP pyrophosphatase (non-canonical NTP hydrolase)
MNKQINRITREDIEEYGARNNSVTVNAFDTYQHIATKSAIYPGQGTALGLAYVALKLNGEAGEFAEHVGKAMRDDALMSGLQCHLDGSVSRQFTPMSDARRTALIKEVGDVLWYVSAACNELGIHFSEVALTNLEKLCDRGERDALRGSGDER